MVDHLDTALITDKQIMNSQRKLFYIAAFFMLVGTFISGSIHIANAITPDLLGTYTGSGTQTWWNCIDSISNGTYQTSVVLIIDKQNGNNFSGTAIETASRYGLTGKNYATLSGIVDSQSHFSGVVSSSLYIESIFDSSAEGTFSGKLAGNILTVQALGKDIVGDTCSGTATWNLEREIQVTLNPTLTPIPGIYTNPQTITISSSTPSASIHFTIDGTEPIESSPVYSSPILVSKTTTIKAKAFKSGLGPSETVIGIYIIRGGIPAIQLLLLGD